MTKNPRSTLYWAEAYTTFGDVIFYGTAKGLMGVELSLAHKSATKQMRKIRKESFPQWELVENPRPILEHIGTAIDFIHMRSTKLPWIFLNGTPFQILVWKELMRTQLGETLSYSELAARIEKPNATRAVASAVAKNRFALLVPCHRVIRKDGSPGEYRWGAKRKEKILRMELQGQNAHSQRRSLR
jgi:AraC family transcriptional regulator of adaptative response/methylated-DNA-[protein]-cysteine methyltransferase